MNLSLLQDTFQFTEEKAVCLYSTLIRKKPGEIFTYSEVEDYLGFFEFFQTFTGLSELGIVETIYQPYCYTCGENIGQPLEALTDWIADEEHHCPVCDKVIDIMSDSRVQFRKPGETE